MENVYPSFIYDVLRSNEKLSCSLVAFYKDEFRSKTR